MQRLKVGVPYIFTKTVGDKIEQAEIVRWGDGSASVDKNDSMSTSYDCDPDAWAIAVADLEREGFRFAGRKTLD